MSDKAMKQLCIPFIMAIIVVVLFYIIFGICILIGEILMDGMNIFNSMSVFFDIFDGRSTAGIVVAAILWLGGTIVWELNLE